jgi:multidrug resistance efflux pump
MDRTPVPASHRRLVSIAVWLGIVVLVGSAAVAWRTLNLRADAPSSGERTSQVERRAVAVAYVDVEGGVSQLYPVRSGRITEVLAEEGKEFPAGAPLLRIDDTLAKIQVAEARIDLAAAQERLTQAKRLEDQHQKRIKAQKAAIAAARREVDAARAKASKARRFAEKKIDATPEDVKAAEAVVAKAEAGVRVEEAKLELLESADSTAAVRLADLDVQSKRKQLEKAEYGLEQCTVTAPEKGSVLRCLVRRGEVLGPNPQQPALIFCPSKPRIVRAEVEQEFATRIAIGQKASIVDYATGRGDWRGTVAQVSDWYTQRRSVLHEPLQYNDVRTLEVIINLQPNPKQPLRIGQRVLVTLDGAR